MPAFPTGMSPVMAFPSCTLALIGYTTTTRQQLSITLQALNRKEPHHPEMQRGQSSRIPPCLLTRLRDGWELSIPTAVLCTWEPCSDPAALQHLLRYCRGRRQRLPALRASKTGRSRRSSFSAVYSPKGRREPRPVPQSGTAYVRLCSPRLQRLFFGEKRVV